MPQSAILPTILLLDPDRAMRLVLTQALGRAGYQARAAANLPTLMAWLEDGEGDLLIADHETLAQDGAFGAIATTRSDLPLLTLGAPEGGPACLPKPFDLEKLQELVRKLLQAPSGPVPDTRAHQPAALSGHSTAIEDLRQGIARLAASPLPLLLLGEEGSGRSMVVRILHETGPRKAGPLITADCTTAPPDQQGTWLDGLFSRASFGTLYLTQAQALGPSGQHALLRALQERDHSSAECRLVVSADRDLQAHVDAGLMRADLHYRLDTVRLRVPPLRERREDIATLAAHFWQAAHVGIATDITDTARALLARQPWKRNLSELKALLGAIARDETGATLTEAMIETALDGDRASPQAVSARAPETLQAAIARHIDHYLTAYDLDSTTEGHLHDEVIAEVERPLITGVLNATNGNQIRAAAILGMNRNTLRKRIRDLGIATRTGRRGNTRHTETNGQ